MEGSGQIGLFEGEQGMLRPPPPGPPYTHARTAQQASNPTLPQCEAHKTLRQTLVACGAQSLTLVYPSPFGFQALRWHPRAAAWSRRWAERFGIDDINLHGFEYLAEHGTMVAANDRNGVLQVDFTGNEPVVNGKRFILDDNESTADCIVLLAYNKASKVKLEIYSTLSLSALGRDMSHHVVSMFVASRRGEVFHFQDNFMVSRRPMPVPVAAAAPVYSGVVGAVIEEILILQPGNM